MHIYIQTCVYIYIYVYSRLVSGECGVPLGNGLPSVWVDLNLPAVKMMRG